MAQHDYNIANATFPNTRTDINNALTAIATNNSGDSAPSTTFANQWWYETDTNKLYIRNEDNDAFIHILTLNQTNDTVASLEGASTLAGIDDQSSSNDDQITIKDAEVVINEDSDDLDFRVESNSGTHALFVDGGNNVVIVGGIDGSGTTPVPTNTAGGLDPVFQLQGANNANQYSMHISAGIASAGSPPRLVMSKSRDNTLNGNTILQDDDAIGAITFAGADGTDRNSVAAEIIANVDGTPSGNDMPGRLVFLTTADGASSSTERMRITQSGDVLIGTVSATIDSSNFGIALRYYGEVRMARDAAGSSPCLDVYGTAGQFRVMGDGDVENTNNRIGSISDERIKTNITDANSQWDDIKAIKVRNFERKDDVAKYGAGKKIQIGVVAQEVESISPGLVKERDPTEVEINMSSEFGTLYTADDAETKDGNDAVLYVADDQEVIDGESSVGDIKMEATHSKKVGDIKDIKDQVKSVGYSVLYMKAIKALQEAMTKIEDLETRVTTLEG